MFAVNSYMNDYFMALFVTLNIVWPVAIIVLLLCAKCFYAAMQGNRSADVPHNEQNVMIDASSAPFAMYAMVEEFLAGRGVPEQVIDGCIGLLKQYVVQGGVESVKIVQKPEELHIVLYPRNIVIKVK